VEHEPLLRAAPRLPPVTLQGTVGCSTSLAGYPDVWPGFEQVDEGLPAVAETIAAATVDSGFDQDSEETGQITSDRLETDAYRWLSCIHPAAT
jgi:hypothetical protein